MLSSLITPRKSCCPEKNVENTNTCAQSARALVRGCVYGCREECTRTMTKDRYTATIKRILYLWKSTRKAVSSTRRSASTHS